MEAISTVPGDDKEKNKLIHIEQIGFKHKDDDRILRPCRVIVGK
jgi:molecular chaperone GrpE (heat shock protein)